MADGIQKLNLDDAAAQLREKIKFAFAELIPDEQWEAMIKSEWEAFTKPSSRGHGYSSEPAGFRKVAESVLREQVNAAMKSWFEEQVPNGRNYNSDGCIIVGEFVTKYLDENADKLMRVALEGLFGTAMQNLLMQARSGYAG